MSVPHRVQNAQIQLNRDHFTRTMLHHLAAALTSQVGTEEAEALISQVANKMGHSLNSTYCNALDLPKLSKRDLAGVLLDLKQRIGGYFELIEETPHKLVFRARRCPFGFYVKGRPSLCMMTSNVFGRISAQSHGYAKVALEETIARGDGQCLVVVYLQKSDEADKAGGREYQREAQ